MSFWPFNRPRKKDITPLEPFSDRVWEIVTEVHHEKKVKYISSQKLQTATFMGIQGFMMGMLVGGSVMLMHGVVSRQFEGMGRRALTAGSTFGVIFLVGNMLRNVGPLLDPIESFEPDILKNAMQLPRLREDETFDADRAYQERTKQRWNFEDTKHRRI